jgi:hypothetical protein
MQKIFLAVSLTLAIVALPSFVSAQDKPAIVVHTLTATPGQPWPYDRSRRETAKIHYWLTDASGKKVFDHTDTIRAAFWGNGYADSVGQLAQPFADKIADRLAEAKL